MAIKLQLSDQNIKEWEEIIGFPHDKLNGLTRELSNLAKPALRLNDLRKRINAALGSDKSGTLFGRHLIRLATLIDDEKLTPEESVEALTDSLRLAGWPQDKLESLSEFTSALVPLLNTDAVCFVAKSLRLTYVHPNILQDAGVVTDIRPIFSRDRSEIAGAMIMQTLTVEYLESGKKKSISFALDESDLENLRDISIESLNKAELSQKLISDNCDLTAFIVGDDSDGNS